MLRERWWWEIQRNVLFFPSFCLLFPPTAPYEQQPYKELAWLPVRGGKGRDPPRKESSGMYKELAWLPVRGGKGRDPPRKESKKLSR